MQLLAPNTSGPLSTALRWLLMGAKNLHDDPATSTLPEAGPTGRPLALMETLFQRAPVGFALVDRELRFVRINDVLAAGHGASAAEQIGKTVQEVIPDLWPSLEPLCRRALAGETIVNDDVTTLSSTGEASEWLVSYYPVYLQGEVTGVGIIANDISERRRMEDALRVRSALYDMLSRTHYAVRHCGSSDELFRAVCAIAVDAGKFRFAWIGVPDGNRVNLVASAGDDQGYMSEAVITLEDADPCSQGPTGRAFARQVFVVNDFMASPFTAPWHALARRVGFAASAAFPLTEHGQTVAVLNLYASTPGFFTDELLTTLAEIAPSISIALERFAQQRGRQRDLAELQMLDRAIRAVSQGIVITDPHLPDHPIIYASPGFERLSGYSVDEAVGKNCRFLRGPGTDPASVASVRDAIRDGRACSVEMLNYRKDGTPFWNQLIISPIRDAEGHLTNFVGVQTDVTDRRQLEAQLRQAQKLEAVGRLAGGVAHDFNNLLSVVLSYSEIILAGMNKGDPIRGDLEEIQGAGLRAADLTRQLLMFSRQQVLEPKVLDLNDLLAGMSKMLQRILDADVALISRPARELGAVRADPSSVEQIIMNLVVNARDAMPMGGTLTMETSNVVLDEAYAAAHLGVAPGPHVMLAVTDTGTGIDKATLARIFEPFFTTKASGKGTGLGLTTVFGVVQQSGGSVSVCSEVGKGTTFKVYFPRVDDAPETTPTSEAPRPTSRGTETILLVEDDDRVRLLARNILRRSGYHVIEASNGAEALLRSEEHRGTIHLLLSDVVMPQMGGPALAKRLTSVRPEMRVLCMSGYADDSNVRHGVVEARIPCIEKPITPVSLTTKVREVLDWPRTSS
jgi:two-component system cell cycle sensor histidine kinase/response regulator CckA